MGKLLKWQEQFIAQVEALDNRSFFERMLEENEPDDYDGCMTSQGAWRSQYMVRRMIEKLIDAGWIKPIEYKPDTIDRTLNCRTAKRILQGRMEDINPEEIKKGMFILLFEPDGSPVMDNGVTAFVATSDAKIDENGVVGFEYEVAPIGKTKIRFNEN